MPPKTDLKFYMYLFSYINCTIRSVLCQGKIRLKIVKKIDSNTYYAQRKGASAPLAILLFNPYKFNYLYLFNYTSLLTETIVLYAALSLILMPSTEFDA